MRTWRNLSARNDDSAWFDVDGVWPTVRGTYESADYGSAAQLAATGATSVLPRYAFQGNTLSGRREYVVLNNAGASSGSIYEYSGGGFTARTFAGSMALYPMMVQYGNVTVLVKGAANTTNISTGANFSDLAGAPNGEIAVVCSNSVVIFNTNASTDGWHASDVGDYTNWTTGEAASGRLIQTPGAITAAVVYGDVIYAFKENSIYRGRYVGGAVKWTWEVVWAGLGCKNYSLAVAAKYQCCVGRSGILFSAGLSGEGGITGNQMYLFDGSSPPVLVNPETELGAAQNYIVYNPVSDTFTCVSSTNGAQQYFCAKTGAWGRHVAPYALYASVTACAAQMGEFSASSVSNPSNFATMYHRAVVDKIDRVTADGGSASTVAYLETTKVGRPDRKTQFSRLIPLLRRRRDLGTDSAALSFTLWRELHDTSPQSTRAVTETSGRHRFDLLGGASTDNFARFKVTFTALDVEVDDFMVISKDTGAE